MLDQLHHAKQATLAIEPPPTDLPFHSDGMKALDAAIAVFLSWQQFEVDKES